MLLVVGQQGVLMETFNNISGSSVSSLTGNAKYPNAPDASSIATSFESPSNQANAYGLRMRAYVTPTTTGDYTFWIASDDNGELRLSTNESSTNASLIASVGNWTSPRQWTKYASQKSAVVSLVAGQKYYMEALMKEGGGGDNLAVGWSGSGISGTQVIGGAYLTPFVPGGSAPTAAHQWKLNEGSGTSTSDSAGSANGTLTNGPTWTAGQNGQALDFDGSNDSVDISGMTSTSSITISAWINPDTISGKRAIAGQQDSFSFRTTGNKLTFTTPGKVNHTASIANIVANQWQHVAVTFTANGSVKFYLNGVLFSTRQDSTGFSATSNTAWIGRNQWGERFDGGIDDVRIFDSALSDADILSVKNDTNG